MNWRINVLGGLSLERGAQAVITHFESRKVAALLAYLALFPQHPHPREELMELLWPDEEPEKARQRLRQALYALRQQLEPPGTTPGSVLIATRHVVALNAACFTCDARLFEQLARQQKTEEAAAVYKGELLPGFYDDWILQERTRLALIREELCSHSAIIPPAVLLNEVRRDGSERELLLVRQPELHLQPVVFLPAYLTPVFGREQEQEELAARLRVSSLVTLTGMGGIGKTRLSVETARALTSEYEVIAFVPLADCHSPAQILDAIRGALHLLPRDMGALEQLTQMLTERKTLLILDNFEQLVEAGGADVAQALLTYLPTLTLLVTSRRLLGIVGEQEFPLSSLPLPEPPADGLDTHPLPPDSLPPFMQSAAPADIAFAQKTEFAMLAILAANPSIALFVHRAQAARPSFQLTHSNQADLVTLCRALEGMPLALELAASRIRVLSPAEMRAQLADRLQWLVRSGPGGDKQPRHRSLRATLEWSWQMLPTAQQKFLSALSVFRGGWTADSAARVCETEDARERIEMLMMDSLIVSATDISGITRFQMPDTVRTFAAEKLLPETRARFLRSHQAAFLQIAQEKGGNATLLKPDADNFLLALDNAIANIDADAALALCLALDSGLMAFVGASAALGLLQRALHLPGGELRTRVKTLYLATYLALIVGDKFQALQLAEAALQSAQEPTAERAFALLARACVAITCLETNEPVEDWLDQARHLTQQAGEARAHATVLRQMGIRAGQQGDYPAAEQYLQDSLRAYQAIDDAQGALYSRDCLANICIKRDDMEQALRLYEACRKDAANIGDTEYEAKVYLSFSCIYGRQQKWHNGLNAARESVRRNHALGNTYILAHTLWNIAEPLAYLEQESAAALLLSFATRMWTEQYGSLSEDDRDYSATICSRIIAKFGEAHAYALQQTGANLTLLQAICLALHTPTDLA